MNTLNNKNLKLAVQKEGRLTNETLEFLWKAGFEFESYKQKLFSVCRNFPLEIVFVRDDDIPRYVGEGIVDLGIVGQNLLYEQKAKVKKLLNLRFGYCSLMIAVSKESSIKKIEDLKKKKIATTYPLSTKTFLKRQKIEADVVEISGSVEIAPSLGVASAIVDLTSTGSTLALNDLRILAKIYDSEAVFIASGKVWTNGKKDLLEKLLIRFKAVLSAKNYKYVVMKKGTNYTETVIKEDVLWEKIDDLRKDGTTAMYILPIEKIIT